MFLSLFGRPVSADAEGMGDRSPGGDFWFTPIGMRSIMGARINEESAMRLSAVYACVRVLAETMAILPFTLYRRKENGGKELVTDHWLYRLLAKKPNRWQNAFEWREMMQGHLALRGNGYNRIIDNGRGEIVELLPIHPDRCRPELVNNQFTGVYLVQSVNGVDRVPRGEIFHLRGLSSNGILGLNPIEIMADTLGLGLAAQTYGAKFFKNDARPGGWIERVQAFKDKDARKAFQDSWQEGQGGANRGKTAVLDGGMKYHELGLSNRDSQFIEVRNFSVTDIARCFRMPPHLIGDLTRSTNNNIEQQSLEFVTFTMTPWAERWEASIDDQLLPPDEDLIVEFDFANLLRGDLEARTTYINAGITNGWITRNEARIADNREPLEGLDEPLTPMNMGGASDTAKPKGPKPAPTTPPAEDPAPADEEEPKKKRKAEADRLAALQISAAARVVRKEVSFLSRAGGDQATIEAFFDGHAEFVAEVMAVEPDIARHWCGWRVLSIKTATAGGRAPYTEQHLSEKLIACACKPAWKGTE